jgi:hypothetical protein
MRAEIETLGLSLQMNLYHEIVLKADRFEEPFRSMFLDVEARCRDLYEPLRQHLKAPWADRPLVIQVVDNRDLNAMARSGSNADYITVFLGTLERIYGTTYGLLSTPTFLPDIGNCGLENKPTNLGTDGFPLMPLLRTDGSPSAVDTLIPNDPTRLVVAGLLGDLAMEFLLFHEIGHIVGGHLELTRAKSLLEFDSRCENDGTPSRHILECDADMFAADITSAVQLTDKIADSLNDLVPNVPWSKRDFALIIYFAAIGVLFRTQYCPVELFRFCFK